MAKALDLSQVPHDGGLPQCNVFDYLFGNPFETEGVYTPKSQIVPRVRDDATVFIDEASDRVLPYGKIREDALTLAANLHSRGLDPTKLTVLPRTATCARPEVAPVVVVQLPNSLAFATAVLGTWAAGLTVTLVSPALTPKEISWVLQNSRPAVVITAAGCLENMRQAIDAQEDKAHFKTVDVFTVDIGKDPYPLPRSGAPEGDWRKLLEPTSRKVAAADYIKPEDVKNRTAVIFWSSGTSGRSKGVLLSHNALNYSVASLWHDADFYQGKAQRWLGYVPFFHVFGLVNGFLLAVASGATVYTMPVFKLDAVLKAIAQRKITYLHMAPPVAVMLAKSPLVEQYAKRDAYGNNGFSSIVAGVTGGAPLGHEIIVQVYERLGFVIRMGYGLSEACSVTVQRCLNEKEMRSSTNDTGKAHFGVELRIAGPDFDPLKEVGDGSAEVGSEGEILIRSPCLMMAYLPAHGLLQSNGKSKPISSLDMAATDEALTKDGWLRTGDVGHLNADGILCITDRIKELIKVRAFQVAPAELEALLCGSDEVADAGVIGVHDAESASESPRAYVVAADKSKANSKPELEALAHRLKALVEEHTARYKWLTGGMVFVNEVPKSPSGKILRRVLKEGKVQGVHEVALYQRKKRDQKL